MRSEYHPLEVEPVKPEQTPQLPAQRPSADEIRAAATLLRNRMESHDPIFDANRVETELEAFALDIQDGSVRNSRWSFPGWTSKDAAALLEIFRRDRRRIRARKDLQAVGSKLGLEEGASADDMVARLRVLIEDAKEAE